jgi:ketosteroid isomerase-like protein
MVIAFPRAMAYTVRMPYAMCVVLIAIFASAPLAQAPASATAQTAPAPQEPSVTLPAPLQRVLSDYEAGWLNRGDASALAGLFVEDGFALSPGRPPVRGRDAIRQYYAAGKGAPLSLRAIAYGVDGRLAYIIGAFAPRAGDPDSGKFVLVLRQDDDGRWLIVSDIENGNARR